MEKSAIPTPIQRYISNSKAQLEEKRKARQELIIKEQHVQERIRRVKSNSSEGTMCGNCHMRLKHTARTCKFERCDSVYKCGEEKLHTKELSELKQFRQSINKLDSDILQLTKDIENKTAAVEKVQNSTTVKIENDLQVAGDMYTEKGLRNWPLLRKHVFAIETYCKKKMSR